MNQEFKDALQTGWRPTMEDGNNEFSLAKKFRVTWIPHLELWTVRTNGGRLVLNEYDLEEARQHNLRRAYAEEGQPHDSIGIIGNSTTYNSSIQRTGES